MNINKIGLRTIKTTIAVFLSLLIFSSEAFFACMTAIICLQNTITDSIEIGKERVKATILGGTVGGVFLFLIQKISIPKYIKLEEVVVYLLISLGILATIYVTVSLKIPDSVSLTSTVFLAITTTYAYDNPFNYAANRLVETFFGIAIAVLVNRYCNFGRRSKEEIK